MKFYPGLKDQCVRNTVVLFKILTFENYTMEILDKYIQYP